MTNDSSKALRDASREKLVQIMQSSGYQVYDSDSDDALRENIRLDIEGGLMDERDLFNPNLPDPRDR